MHHFLKKYPVPVVIPASAPGGRGNDKKRKKKGFTLIELLVVIAIIGVLASIVLASLNSARAKARDARRLADIKEIEKALQLYYDANRSYPNVTYSADGSLAGWEVSFLSNFMEYLQPYISRTPLDPINSGPPSSMFNARPDGTFFYNYYHYGSGTPYGCTWSGPFAILGFRAFEKMNPATLPQARCGPQSPSCPGGGVANSCRNWSTEFDYSLFLVD